MFVGLEGKRLKHVERLLRALKRKRGFAVRQDTEKLDKATYLKRQERAGFPFWAELQKHISFFTTAITNFLHSLQVSRNTTSVLILADKLKSYTARSTHKLLSALLQNDYLHPASHPISRLELIPPTWVLEQQHQKACSRVLESMLEMLPLRPHPDLLSPSLHFNVMMGDG